MREACEAYLGTTPKNYEELTPDQLLLMLLPRESLKESGGGVVALSLSQAKAKGLIKEPPPGSKFADLPPGPSLVQRLRAAAKQKAAQPQQSERQKARESRAAGRLARDERRKGGQPQ